VEDLKKMAVPVREIPMHGNSPDMLLKNRLSGIVTLATTFDEYLNRQPEKYKNIVKVEPPIWEKPYYLMLSHKFVSENPQLSGQIWNAIHEIKQSQTFTEIVDRYIGD